MINLKNKIIFIHIPKCGGGSISELLTSNFKIEFEKITTSKIKNHVKLVRYIEFFDIKNLNDFYIFVVVRNPYKRLYS